MSIDDLTGLIKQIAHYLRKGRSIIEVKNLDLDVKLQQVGSELF